MVIFVALFLNVRVRTDQVRVIWLHVSRTTK